MKDEGRVRFSRWVLFWSIAACGTAFDLVTKTIVFSRVGPPGPGARPHVIIPRVLELHTSENTGALWGFGASLPGSSMIFAGLSVVAALVIFYYLFILGAAASRVLTIALGLIMAGAMGNCFDRLWFGYVRDFVHFHIDAINFDCAIFNFADNMLVIGALTLVIYALRPEKPRTGPQIDDRTGWSAHLDSGDVDAAQAGSLLEAEGGEATPESRMSPSVRSA
jgi:signal peptidase II